MLPLKDEDLPIVRALLGAGCCARCVLRFCCVSVQSAYRQPYQDILLELQSFIRAKEADGSGDGAKKDPGDAPPCKKVRLETEQDSELHEEGEAVSLVQEKSNICVVCLGVLQDFCDKDFAKKVAETVISEKYEFDSLVLSVSLPAQLSVREHAVWLLVKTEVRAKGLCLGKDDVIQVKEAFKWILQSLVSQRLGVPVVSKSVFTRMAVAKALERISEESFRRKFPCPPQPPATRCTVQEVQCLRLPIFVAGRYNKFSRMLPQTPWVIDGERRMESSVEELITTPLVASFQAEGFNFSSSGREDVDVRTLGNGRPFVVELLNPRKTSFSGPEVRQIQEVINKSSEKIRVRDLQIVTRDAVGHMKEGEEEKTKSYSALIWTHRPIEAHDLEFINDIKDLSIAQKTPLRVLHRRPLAVRQRLIHTMSVRYRDAHHFQLQLRTQAGTYIKEFVHGDFGRTKPNLCDLLKTEVDILELDVESVDVDWPPSVTDPEFGENPDANPPAPEHGGMAEG